ncbi:MAG TPA: DUF4386 domain-containing protein [Actinomycetota bacterium]|nr:DUF4386 domain-containing protein [Actinomycetota bacterium]
MADTTIIDGRHTYRLQALGRVFGWFFLATFFTSIPAYFIGYARVLDDPGLITGAGADPTTGVATAATLEVFLIIANVATAVVAYPVLKRESEIGAVGYVSARLVEGIFIAIGIVSALAFILMRQEATAVSDPVIGEGLVALYYRAFLVGPGFMAGLANGVILGYLMYRSELVPRGMTWLGLIGGPLVMATGIAIMFDAIERGGAIQAIATIPEFVWELSLSIYCIVKGFRPSPVLGMESVTTLPESDSALRHGA